MKILTYLKMSLEEAPTIMDRRGMSWQQGSCAISILTKWTPQSRDWEAVINSNWEVASKNRIPLSCSAEAESTDRAWWLGRGAGAVSLLTEGTTRSPECSITTAGLKPAAMRTKTTSNFWEMKEGFQPPVKIWEEPTKDKFQESKTKI